MPSSRGPRRTPLTAALLATLALTPAACSPGGPAAPTSPAPGAPSSADAARSRAGTGRAGVETDAPSSDGPGPSAPTSRPATAATASAAVTARTQPSPEAPEVRTLAAGTPLQVACQAYGVPTDDSTTWNRLTDGSWVPASVTSLATMTLPYCRVETGAPTPTPNPHGPSTLPLGTAELSPRAQYVQDLVEENFPGMACEHYATTRAWSHHSLGSAFDCYPTSDGVPQRDWQTTGNESLKMAVATWLTDHHEVLKVSNVINSQAWWTRATGTWTPYTRLTGLVGGHFNHVHVSVVDPRHEEDKGLS